MKQNRGSGISTRHGLTRRSVLSAGLAITGVLARAPLSKADEPKRGGVLKLGLAGASTTNNMDPSLMQDPVSANQSQQVHSCLIDIDANTELVPGLAESWNANGALDTWQFNLRKGIEFHNGKTLVPDDVIYSLERHIAKDSKSAAKALLGGIKRISADGPSGIKIELSGADANFPYVLGDYHLGIVQKDFTDWSKPIGTGPFSMKTYEPGVRSYSERNKNYFRDREPYVDAVEVIAINDWTARLNALKSGEVDIINRVDNRTAGPLTSSSDVKIVASPGRTHYCFVMDTRVAPFSDPNVRLALKHAIDRDAILKTVLAGFGSIGNDHSVPRSDPMYAELPQHTYDPEKAKDYLKKAGLSNLKLDLSAADGAFAGSIDMALLLQQSAKAARIEINVIREPDDGYWDNVWMKKAFYMSWFGGRPTADLMLTLAYKSDSSWNDTFWKSEEFDNLLVKARATADVAARKALYAKMQSMIWETGGYLIPVFGNSIDAHGARVGGFLPNPNNELMNLYAARQVWLET